MLVLSEADRRYAGVTHIDVMEFDAAAATRVQEMMADAGVSNSALGYYPNSWIKATVRQSFL